MIRNYAVRVTSSYLRCVPYTKDMYYVPQLPYTLDMGLIKLHYIIYICTLSSYRRYLFHSTT